jgi:L-alanine-DL-glutamate epimerase-like enolase superfamily enzyme
MRKTVLKKIEIRRLRARLTQPFRIALGQHDELDNVLLTLELADGTPGYGEAAVATHITGETVDGTLAVLKRTAGELTGRDVSDYLRISAEYGEKLKDFPCALAALETALLDALTRQWKMPLWKFFGPSPKLLRTDMTVVIGNVRESEEVARQIYRRGMRAFKIKIGKDPDEDFERVLCVHRIARGRSLYLDANQAFDAKGILGFLKRLARRNIEPEVLEQPVPKDDWEGLAKVTRESKTTVLADESVRSLADAVRVVGDRAADGINIKLMKFGLLRSREIARLASAAGLKLMVGCMMESALATGASAHLAAGLGGFDYIDLDTPFFIKDRIMKYSHLSSGGVYDLRKVRAGIGVAPQRSFKS